MSWRAYRGEMLALGLLGAAGIAGFAGVASSTPALPPNPVSASLLAPAPASAPPLLVRDLAPQDAYAINEAIPLAAGPNRPAKPFSMGRAGAEARARALECLTSAVYYEAGSEGVDGQRAVAQVVLNRVRHPAFPASVCGVVYEGSTRATGCQFTFTCDGSLARPPGSSGWSRAREIAEAALNGKVYAPVGTATHYHAAYVVPYWASELAKNAVVGTHIFYRWSGSWGRPPAFVQRYAQAEPDAKALKLAAAATGKPELTLEEMADVPGAQVLASANGRAGREQLSVRFNLSARKAVEAAPRQPYVERVTASDNLRWSLSSAAVQEQGTPLGRPAPKAEPAVGEAPAPSPF